MFMQTCSDLAIDQYEAAQGRKRTRKAVMKRNAIEVHGIINDLWEALAKLGNQVDWAKAMSHYGDMIGKLFSGETPDQIAAWVLENFPLKTPPKK